jgi:hypothetical protein
MLIQVKYLADCPEYTRLPVTRLYEAWSRASHENSPGKVEPDRGEVLDATGSLAEGSAVGEGRNRRLFQASKADDTWSPGKTIPHAAVVHGETTAGIGSPVCQSRRQPLVRHGLAGATSSFGAGLLGLPGCGIDCLISQCTGCIQGRILDWLHTSGQTLKRSRGSCT